jgi:hypothetical protein
MQRVCDGPRKIMHRRTYNSLEGSLPSHHPRPNMSGSVPDREDVIP